jgi:hypothetical protein
MLRKPAKSVSVEASPRRIDQLDLAIRYNYNVVMSSLRFDWDFRKAAANEKKHGVSFEDAKSVFYDEHARLIDDPDHSGDEDRFILLGWPLPADCSSFATASVWRAE